MRQKLWLVGLMLLGAPVARAHPARAYPVELAEVGGRIAAGPSGEPLGVPATVFVYAGDACVGSIQTAEDGTFLLHVPPGAYELHVFAAEAQVALSTVQVQPGGQLIEV